MELLFFTVNSGLLEIGKYDLNILQVALHERMRRGLNSNRVLRLNIVTGMAPSRFRYF